MTDYVVVDKEHLESDLTVVADAIREKSGTSEPLEFPLGMKNAVEAIQSGGGNVFELASSVSGAFSFKTFDYPLDLEITFGKGGCNANGIAGVTNTSKGIRTIKIKCLTKGVLDSLSNSFQRELNNTDLEIVDLSEAYLAPLKDTTRAFYRAGGLKQIIGELDLSAHTGANNYSFQYLKSLEEIRFKPSSILYSVNFAHSSRLSTESIQSIIEGLTDEEQGQTLTLHDDVIAQLDVDQINEIEKVGWTIG